MRSVIVKKYENPIVANDPFEDPTFELPLTDNLDINIDWLWKALGTLELCGARVVQVCSQRNRDERINARHDFIGTHFYCQLGRRPILVFGDDKEIYVSQPNMSDLQLSTAYLTGLPVPDMAPGIDVAWAYRNKFNLLIKRILVGGNLNESHR